MHSDGFREQKRKKRNNTGYNFFHISSSSSGPLKAACGWVLKTRKPKNPKREMDELLRQGAKGRLGSYRISNELSRAEQKGVVCRWNRCYEKGDARGPSGRRGSDEDSEFLSPKGAILKCQGGERGLGEGFHGSILCLIIICKGGGKERLREYR